MYSVWVCQHTYFRLNCAERDLVLAGADGDLELYTDDDWHIQRVVVSITGHLERGEPSADGVAYIKERMAVCPTSVNLPTAASVEVTIGFD